MRSALLGLGLGLGLACTPPSAGPGASGSTSIASTGSDPDPGTTGWPPSATLTFGTNDPADDGAEVGFVGPLDVGCGGGEALDSCVLCDVREQGCVDDLRCVAWADDEGRAWNATRCIERAPAPVGNGEPCVVEDRLVSGRDDCSIGAMCWDADPVALAGTCVPFCGPPGSEPACPAGTACMLDGTGALALCRPPCDPIDPAPCPEGSTCRYFSMSAAAFCIPDGGGRVLSLTIQCGEAGEECPASEVCISAASFGGCGAPSCCASWCDVDRPDADERCDASRPGHACVPVFDDGLAPEGYAALGVCAEPVR